MVDSAPRPAWTSDRGGSSVRWWGCGCEARGRGINHLDVEADVQRVAVGDHIVAAFDPHPAAPLGLGLRTGLDEPVPLDHLGPDEAAFEIGVDPAGRLLRVLAAPDRPRACLLRPGPAERDPAEQ